MTGRNSSKTSGELYSEVGVARGPRRSHGHGVQKDWKLSKRARLEFRWEIFNLFNRTNFDVPNRIAFTPNFGRIFSADNPRQMQFGLKLIF